MKFGLYALSLSPYFDEEGGGGAPAAPIAPGGNVGAPAPSASQAAPAAPSFSYKEDRSNWVPSHVIRDSTAKAAAREAQFQAQLTFERERVAALSGVKMQPQVDPEQNAIREQFFKMFPKFKSLEDNFDKFEKAANYDYESIQKSQEQSWTAHGNQVLQSLSDQVKQAYGGAELTPKALQRLQRSFINEVQEDPDVRARYDAGDMSIVSEFVKEYTSGLLDPYRRQQSAAAGRPAAIASKLPRGGGSSAVVGNRPASLKPTDPGFHEAAFRRLSGE